MKIIASKKIQHPHLSLAIDIFTAKEFPVALAWILKAARRDRADQSLSIIRFM
jgi:hypothetical protein